MAEPTFGNCAVCGHVRLLTKEHVPAASMGNRGEQLVYGFEHVMGRGELLLPEAAPRGFVLRVLCFRCNNDTGNWYVERMKAFVQQGQTALDRIFRPAATAAGIVEPEVRTVDFHIEPLAVIKYVVTMMLVTCRSAWPPSGVPELRRFALDPEAKGLPPAFRFYAGLTYGPYNRITGLAHAIQPETGRTVHIAEVSFGPVAFVMTIGQPAHESTWPGEITHFAAGDYQWAEPRDVRISMATGFTSPASMMPGILPSPASHVDAHMKAFLEADAY